MKTISSLNRWQAVAALVLLAGTAAALLAGLQTVTKERIRTNEAEKIGRSLAVLLPLNSFDNSPQLDVISLTDREALGSTNALPAYRARLGDKPVAVVLSVLAPDAYVDTIRLLVGIRYDGSLIGVRVTEHRETPGLGDGIDVARSDWILGFGGRGLANPAVWQLRRDGGELDALTGATITSRAVMNAVQRALLYFASHRDMIFAPPKQSAHTRTRQFTAAKTSTNLRNALSGRQ